MDYKIIKTMIEMDNNIFDLMKKAKITNSSTAPEIAISLLELRKANSTNIGHVKLLNTICWRFRRK